MIPEIAAVAQDQPLLADELKIIAGERNGLTAKDRESIRNGALLIDEIMKSYGIVLSRLNEREAELVAAKERLREVNTALTKSNVFPVISAGVQSLWVGYNG